MSSNKRLYIKLYIGITVSIYSAFSTCALFISIMQLVNGAQFLNIISLLILFTGAAWAAFFETDLVPLTRMCASLWSHKFDLIIYVFNLLLLLLFLLLFSLLLYDNRDSSFISTKLLVLNLDGWFSISFNKFIIFWYSIIYFVSLHNLRSSIIIFL